MKWSKKYFILLGTFHSSGVALYLHKMDIRNYVKTYTIGRNANRKSVHRNTL